MTAREMGLAAFFTVAVVLFIIVFVIAFFMLWAIFLFVAFAMVMALVIAFFAVAVLMFLLFPYYAVTKKPQVQQYGHYPLEGIRDVKDGRTVHHPPSYSMDDVREPGRPPPPPPGYGGRGRY